MPTSKFDLNSKVSLKESIATKLLKTGVSLYVLATIVLTAGYMMTEYAYVKKSVIKDLHSLEKTIGMGISKIIWEMDNESLSAMAAGIYETPIVVGLKIEINKLNDIRLGAVLDEHNAFAFFNEQGEHAVSPNKISSLFSYSFPLKYREDEKSYQVGKMVLFSSREVILDRVRVGFSFIIVNALLSTLFLCMIFYVIIQRLLARPLSLLTQAVSSLEMDKLEDVKVEIQTSGKTELKILEHAFNQMISRLQLNKVALQDRAEVLEKELSERLKAEKELQRYKENLEDMIENRTRELNTALELLKDSESRVTTILSSVNTGIIVIRVASRTISDINPVAAKMIRLPRQEIIGKKCHLFICPKEDKDCPIMDHGQQIDNTERILLTAEGRHIPILKTVVPIELNGEKHLLESFVDISARKEAEAQLQSRLEELKRFHQLTIDREHRMIRLKEEINQLNEKLGMGKKYKIVS